ncbi:MAG: hypothetical protein HYY68_03660 [Thaumarchaeota archaeon]|nr:hypothetical protein [Nitrososphaerota archaeon]
MLEPDQPAVRYRALVDLLGRPKDDAEVKEAHGIIAERGWGHDILVQQRPDGHWMRGEDSLYLPKYTATNWRAIMLADLGLTAEHAGVRRAAELYFKEWLSEMERFLEEGELCIVGNLARTLTACGYADDPKVKRLFEWIVQHQKDDGGWHCFKSDSGTLDCWEGLAAYNKLPRQRWTRSIKRSAERGAEFYLDRRLFEEGRRYGPWFRFHYRNHYYYDLFVGLDMITALGCAADKRLNRALDILKQKRRSDGRWVLDAIHPDLAGGAGYSLKRKPVPVSLEAKGKPSKWITLTCMRVLKRVEEA